MYKTDKYGNPAGTTWCDACQKAGRILPGHFACNPPARGLEERELAGKIFRIYENGSWRYKAV